jgi:hypothetical protein
MTRDPKWWDLTDGGHAPRPPVRLAVVVVVVVLAGQLMALAYDRLTSATHLPGPLDLIRTHPSLAALVLFALLVLTGFLVATRIDSGRRGNRVP